MSLFPYKDDILSRLQVEWKGYSDTLRREDREVFLAMMNKCHTYAAAINVKCEPFPNEALLMALIFSQFKMINSLVQKVAELSRSITELQTNVVVVDDDDSNNNNRIC